MGYVVKAPLVVVRDKAGQAHHVYDGGLLPDSADPGHVKQLIADGMVDKAQGPAPAAEEPPRNASREAWVAYAKAKGASVDDDQSRDELRDKYGS